MKKTILLGVFAFLILPTFALRAQVPDDVLGEVATSWPGIHYQVIDILRLDGNRLYVGIRILAAKDAPAKGTLIGISHPIPPTATQMEIASGMFRPGPFSVAAATISDEHTKQIYAALRPDPAYASSVVLAELGPNQACIVGLEFPIPPPPPPSDSESSGAPPKLTFSILIPKATGPIAHLELPPPASGANPAQ